MKELPWFPYDVAAWETRVLELRLSAEDEGTLMRLYRAAWRGEVPATLRDNPDDLARILGAKWRKALPLFHAHFTPIPERPGLLRCAWLSALYDEQLAIHESYRTRGQKGGRPKQEQKAEVPNSKAETKPEVSNTKAELSGSEAQLAPLSRGKAVDSCAPTEHTTINNTTTNEVRREGDAGDALGVETPRVPAKELDKPRDPYQAIEDRATGKPPRHAVELAWGDKYREHLYKAVDAWKAEHPTEYETHQRAVERSHFGLSKKTRSALEEDSIRAGVAERIRVALRWPSQITWISKQRAKARETAAAAVAS